MTFISLCVTKQLVHRDVLVRLSNLQYMFEIYFWNIKRIIMWHHKFIYLFYISYEDSIFIFKCNNYQNKVPVPLYNELTFSKLALYKNIFIFFSNQCTWYTLHDICNAITIKHFDCSTMSWIIQKSGEIYMLVG